MAKKPRIVCTEDGRKGWPDVVEYELTDGPDKGKRLPVPPSIASHPDPSTATPPPASSAEAAKMRAEWFRRQAAGQNMARAGYAFRAIVHDLEAYERLVQTGVLNGPPHRPRSVAEDSRPAPKA